MKKFSYCGRLSIITIIVCAFAVSVLNFTVMAQNGGNSNSWNDLPENAKDEVILKLAKQFPPPDALNADSGADYDKELRKWKANYDKQKEFLARNWLDKNQHSGGNAPSGANDSRQNITAKSQSQTKSDATEGSDIINVHLSKTVADLEMIGYMSTGRSNLRSRIGGQNDKPRQGEKPPTCKMFSEKYGSIYLDQGIMLSAVVFKSQESGKYDRLVIDTNNDKDFTNDKVIEVPVGGGGKELNIKFEDTFIISNAEGTSPYFTKNNKYWMKGDVEYHGKKIQAVLLPSQDGRYTYGSQLFLDINGDGNATRSSTTSWQASQASTDDEVFLLSKYVSLDEKYYSAQINDSATSIKMTKLPEPYAKIDLKGKPLSFMNDASVNLSSYTKNSDDSSGRFMPLINILKKVGDLPISLPADNYDNTSFSIMNGSNSLTFKYNKLELEPGKTKTIALDKPSFDIQTSFKNDMLNVTLKWLPINGIEYGTIRSGSGSDKEPVKITIQTLEGVDLYQGGTGWG